MLRRLASLGGHRPARPRHRQRVELGFPHRRRYSDPTSCRINDDLERVHLPFPFQPGIEPKRSRVWNGHGEAGKRGPDQTLRPNPGATESHRSTAANARGSPPAALGRMLSPSGDGVGNRLRLRSWASGAAVSAAALHAVGRGFESLLAHHFWKPATSGTPTVGCAPPAIR